MEQELTETLPLSDPAEQARRAALMTEPHMQQLASFLEDLRYHEFNKNVPSFDPCDGGCEAQALFLLKSPGAGPLRTGFVSRDNPEPSAANFHQLCESVGIDRRRTLLWHVFPWHQGDQKMYKPEQNAEMKKALPYLKELLDLLPRLRVVVLMGKEAQAIEPLIREAKAVTIIKTFVPSERVINTGKEKEVKVQGDFLLLAQILQRP